MAPHTACRKQTDSSTWSKQSRDAACPTDHEVQRGRGRGLLRAERSHSVTHPLISAGRPSSGVSLALGVASFVQQVLLITCSCCICFISLLFSHPFAIICTSSAVLLALQHFARPCFSCLACFRLVFRTRRVCSHFIYVLPRLDYFGFPFLIRSCHRTTI